MVSWLDVQSPSHVEDGRVVQFVCSTFHLLVGLWLAGNSLDRVQRKPVPVPWRFKAFSGEFEVTVVTSLLEGLDASQF